jgi:hypothetical protein
MSLVNLSEHERHVILHCLQAAADGPFFPDWEFRTLFGCERNDIRAIVAAWPRVDDSDPTVAVAINNAIVNLIGYPHGHDADLPFERPEIERVLARWRSAK